MAKLLRWAIHTLEIFMWEEDYDLSPDEDLFEDDDLEAEEPEPETKIYWRVLLEYANKTSQEIVSYQDNLYDKPDELYFALREYFDPEPDESEEEFEIQNEWECCFRLHSHSLFCIRFVQNDMYSVPFLGVKLTIPPKCIPACSTTLLLTA